MPINMPQKGGYYYPHPQHAYGRISGSPPEAAESVTTSGVASYDPSASSSSYAGSASDYDSSSTTAGVDLIEYMSDRLNGSFNPTPLDRSLAKQAQTYVTFSASFPYPIELTGKQIRRVECQTPRAFGTAGTCSAPISRRACQLCRRDAGRKRRAEGSAVDTEASRVRLLRKLSRDC